jgi:hypothetical protein
MGACGSKGDDGSAGGVSAMNDAELSNLQAKIMRKLMKHSNKSSKRVISRQNISVKEKRIGPLDPFYYKEVSISKGPFGIFGKRDNCPVFGCAYEIDQRTSVNIVSFNSSIVEEDESILNDIESKMKQKAEVSLEGDPSGLDAVNKALNETRDIAKENIREILNNISKSEFGSDQNIVIEYQSPPRCKNPCGFDGPSEGPKLNQNAQIQIHSSDIINSTTKIYEKNMQQHGLDVDQSIKTSNDACILQMIGCIICSIMSLIIVWKIIKMVEASAGA